MARDVHNAPLIFGEKSVESFLFSIKNSVRGGEGIRTLINSLSSIRLVSAGERITALPPHHTHLCLSYGILNLKYYYIPGRASN
jgi:hypothetical protein